MIETWKKIVSDAISKQESYPDKRQLHNLLESLEKLTVSNAKAIEGSAHGGKTKVGSGSH